MLIVLSWDKSWIKLSNLPYRDEQPLMVILRAYVRFIDFDPFARWLRNPYEIK